MGSPPGWRRFRRMLATTALMASSAAVSGPQQPFPAAAGGSSSRAQSTVRQLCPATLDPKAYDKTGYRMLRPGYGDWVFRDMVELRHTVPVDAMRARYFHRIAAELKAKGVQDRKRVV